MTKTQYINRRNGKIYIYEVKTNKNDQIITN